MALTEIENVFNLSLGLIGEYEVEDSALSRSSKQYGLCSRFYTSARDEIIARHRWNEATGQVVIMQSTTAPMIGYDYQFALPTDCARANNIGNDWANWEVIGQYIMTNDALSAPVWISGEDYVAGQYVDYNSITYLVANTIADSTTAPDTDTTNFTSQLAQYSIINLTYIKKLSDPTAWSAQLKHAISLNLAIKVSVPITNDTKIKSALIQELEQLVIPQARSVDAQQGTPRKYNLSHWIRSRTSN